MKFRGGNKKRSRRMMVRSLFRVDIAPLGWKNMRYYVINQSEFCAVIIRNRNPTILCKIKWLSLTRNELLNEDLCTLFPVIV